MADVKISADDGTGGSVAVVVSGDPASGFTLAGTIQVAERTWGVEAEAVETTIPPVDPEPEPILPQPGPSREPAPEPLLSLLLGVPSVWSQQEKITVEVPFTHPGGAAGDPVRERCYARFRELGEVAGPWRQCVGDREAMTGEFHRTQAGNGGGGAGSFIGCVLDCKKATEYEIELDFREGDGSQGEVWTLLTTTLAERPDARDLPATYYVDEHGSDAGDGLTFETAWRTLARARTAVNARSVDAPPAVVRMSPGALTSPGAPFTRSVELVTDYGCLDAQRETVDLGQQTIISSGVKTEPGSGAWTQVTPGGSAYPVWMTDTGVGGIRLAGYSVGPRDCPVSLGYWEKNANIATPALWAKGMSTCANGYQAGVHVDGSKVYLKLPSSAPLGTDPNNYYIHFGLNRPVLEFQAKNSGVTGAVIMGGSRGVLAGSSQGMQWKPADDFTLTACCVRLTGEGVRFEGQSWRPVVRGCRVEGKGWYSRSTSGVAPEVQSWGLIKVHGWSEDGTSLGSKPLESSETAGVQCRGARLPMVYECTFDGIFNGVGSYNYNLKNQDGSADRYGGLALHGYRLKMRDIADDCFEPEYSMVGAAFHDCDLAGLVGFSLAPVNDGPVYAYRCAVRCFKPLQIIPPQAEWGGGAAMGAKLSGKCAGLNVRRPGLYFINCVFYAPLSDGSGVAFADGTDSAGDGKCRAWNSVFVADRYAAEWSPTKRAANQWPCTPHVQRRDYNYYTTIRRTGEQIRGIKVGGASGLDCETWQQYLQNIDTTDDDGLAYQPEAHSNRAKAGGYLELDSDPFLQFVDLDAGNYALSEASDLRQAGTPVGNVADLYGATPNIGLYP